MKTKGVLVLQSWFDISTLYTGNALNAFAIANANNRSVTDDLVPGEILDIPSNLLIDNKVLQYYEARLIVPATGFTKENIELFNPQLGIGKMAIGLTCIIR
ncbi:hypothetical protein [Flavobacterium psychrophilum]|uniref:hypothetical protein n=1 Tax=Flavobacterium psychrophilum TaxID=96345 RepID=UPI000B7C1731|nr:hypothetical protein [Flavobacterium psychrophilum]EKT3967120.1 hypothetical protein [Flavobacterium psychrophilum]MBF2024842.1 hypothetical protein [Flavobacterium psychrophilum]MCB5983169.1 hypothetical protein [Flavobacterium psychrophilum]MCB5995486.1 hypothetical protein [Flavobacterium psychrophilum]MCB5997753.1 hypothetical protein [Flavobacterium psychrophilum]